MVNVIIIQELLLEAYERLHGEFCYLWFKDSDNNLYEVMVYHYSPSRIWFNERLLLS